MKKIILLSVLTMTCMSLSFATDPVKNIESCCPIVYESESVELMYDIVEYSKHLTPAYYNKETNALHFEAFGKIKFVQVYSELGEMVYQLPVMSNKLRMSKNLFSMGTYKLSFVFENQTEALETYVKIY